MATPFYSTGQPPNQHGSNNTGGYSAQGSTNLFSTPNAAQNSSSYYTQQQPSQTSQPSQQHPQTQSMPTNNSYQPSHNASTSNFSGASKSSIPMPNLFNPANAATAAAILSGNQDAIFQAGQTFMGKVPGQMEPGVGRVMGALRVYFSVDNRYVQKKMQRVLFPFIFKGWKRQELDPITPPPNADGSYPPSIVQYGLPITDPNAPDLYIPFMSLITYVLLSAFLYGSSGEFTPEVLPDVSTKCIVTQIMEVLLIRFGFYAMQVTIPFLDLFAYTGYKYLGLCVNMLFGLLGFGRNGYYVGFIWTASSVSYFMLKIMSNCIPKHTASEGPKRDLMVMAFAGSQFLTMWFVSQTKYLE